MGVDAEMFVRTIVPITDRQILRWSYELVSAFGPNPFFIRRAANAFGPPRHCLYRIDQYEQDGPDITPEPGETFIAVSLSGRYYGIGSERGDLPLYIGIAQWLECMIPGASVWYGGDSSGICAEPFGAVERAALWLYFVRHGHASYRDFSIDNDGLSRHCDLCDEPMRRNGWGGFNLYAAFYCSGCGFSEETRDGGKTWSWKENAV